MLYTKKGKSMKKVLSLFALCAMFAFAGCAKNKDEQKSKPMKKEHVKKDHKKKDKKKKENKCKTCNAKPCKCKSKKMKYDK